MKSVQFLVIAAVALVGCLADNDAPVHEESSQAMTGDRLSEDAVMFLQSGVAVGSTFTFPESGQGEDGVVGTVDGTIELLAPPDSLPPMTDFTSPESVFFHGRATRILHCDKFLFGPNAAVRGAVISSCYGWRDSAAKAAAKASADAVLANAGRCQLLVPSALATACGAHGDINRAALTGSFSGVPSLPPPSNPNLCGVTSTGVSHTRGTLTCGSGFFRWRRYVTRATASSACGALCF